MPRGHPLPSLVLLSCAALAAGVGCESSQVYFSPEDTPEQVLIDEIGAATRSAHVAIYTFTSEGIRDALVNAHLRGLEVRVYADPDPTNAEVLDDLEREGIAVRLSANERGGIMHDKFTVLDGARVLTGSYNYTRSANELNDENLVLLSSTRLSAQFEAKFQELWTREP